MIDLEKITEKYCDFCYYDNPDELPPIECYVCVKIDQNNKIDNWKPKNTDCKGDHIIY